MSGPWDQYCGPAPVPADLLGRWNLDPLLICAMIAAALLHLLLLLQQNHERSQQWWWFGATWLLLWALFVSPLCALSSALFSVRVAHHIILVAVVAPCAIMALPSRWRAVPISEGALAAVIVVHTVTVWSWHEPSLYAFALSQHLIFWAMQLSLFGTALLLWLIVLSPRVTLFSSVIGLLATMVQMSLLGAIITFAQRALYAPHFDSTEPFGLTALEDQQLAGLIMWVPAVLPYLAAALILLGLHLAHSTLVSRTQ